MSIHIIPITRRRFLHVSARGAVATIAVPLVRAIPDKEVPVDPHRFAFLSDTHIMADPTAVARGINMADHLRQVVAEIAAQTARPAGVVVNGDLATDGSPPTAGAYRHLAQLLDPLTKREMPIHLTMGNCDRRSLFAETLTAMLPGTPPIAGRLVNVLETERANFFLLDSLYNTKQTVTEGDLGIKQVEWLARALDQHAKKPAIVICDRADLPCPHHECSLCFRQNRFRLHDRHQFVRVANRQQRRDVRRLHKPISNSLQRRGVQRRGIAGGQRWLRLGTLVARQKNSRASTPSSCGCAAMVIATNLRCGPKAVSTRRFTNTNALSRRNVTSGKNTGCRSRTSCRPFADEC